MSFPGNQFGEFAGAAAQFVTASDSSWHALQDFFNATSSALYIDGTNNTVASTPGSNGIDNAPYLSAVMLVDRTVLPMRIG